MTTPAPVTAPDPLAEAERIVREAYAATLAPARAAHTLAGIAGALAAAVACAAAVDLLGGAR